MAVLSGREASLHAMLVDEEHRLSFLVAPAAGAAAHEATPKRGKARRWVPRPERNEGPESSPQGRSRRERTGPANLLKARVRLRQTRPPLSRENDKGAAESEGTERPQEKGKMAPGRRRQLRRWASPKGRRGEDVRKGLLCQEECQQESDREPVSHTEGGVKT